MPPKMTLSQRIAHEIHTHIVHRHYMPGERLPTERELAVQYGVSRIPVREAIKILEQRGIVESKHGSGNYVKHIDENSFMNQLSQYLLLCNSDIHQLAAFWTILEDHSIQAAASGRSHEQLENIIRLADECATQIQNALAGKPSSFNSADYALHAGIAQVSDNKIVANLICSLHKNMRLKQNLLSDHASDLTKLIKIHSSMVMGIERRDPEMASQALCQEMALAKKLFEDLSTQYKISELFCGTT